MSVVNAKQFQVNETNLNCIFPKTDVRWLVDSTWITKLLEQNFILDALQEYLLPTF